MITFEVTPQLDLTVPTPVRVPVPRGLSLPFGHTVSRMEGSDRLYPIQRDADALVLVLSGLAGGRTARFRTEEGEVAAGVLLEDGRDELRIVLPEGLLTAYRHASSLPRPFCWPLHGPGQKAVTRAYPMRPDVPGEDRDHPHHRSFWTAYGEVNEVDDWSEESGHGAIRHRRFIAREEGPLFGGFTAELTWVGPQDEPLLEERRTLRAYAAGPDQRLLDYEVVLTAAYEDIHYGDTKEGGILAVRVATSMDGNKGGKIENSLGGVGEKECWGKRATWLDYSGPVEGETLGIGMMDHPGNFRHPCYWHARDYGLVGTNPFAKAAFEGGAKEGAHQKKGESLRFRYRVLLHRGGAKEGRVNDAYHAWVMPPVARLL